MEFNSAGTGLDPEYRSSSGHYAKNINPYPANVENMVSS